MWLSGAAREDPQRRLLDRDEVPAAVAVRIDREPERSVDVLIPSAHDLSVEIRTVAGPSSAAQCVLSGGPYTV